MNRVQQQTGKVARDLIIDTLGHAGEDDEFHDQVMTRCEAAGKIDTSALDTDLLMEDPKVKAAFKKFVDSIVGALQFVEEEFGPTDD